MRFDLKTLLRSMSIASLLAWALANATAPKFFIAIFLIAIIGAAATKRSATMHGIYCSMIAAGFLLVAHWLVLMIEFSTQIDARQFFGDGILLESIYILLFVGIVFILPISWILGAVAGLAVFWIKEVAQSLRKGPHPENCQESLPN